MRALGAFGLFLLVSGCTSAKPGVSRAPDAAAAPHDSLERHKQALARLLGIAPAQIQVVPGVFGTTVIFGRRKGGEPGSDRMSLLVDHGESYGKHGDHDIADLIRARGLFTATAADLVTLVDDAVFESVRSLDAQSAPSVSASATGLSLHFVQVRFPGTRYAVTVHIDKEGPARVEAKPLAEDNTAEKPAKPTF